MSDTDAQAACSPSHGRGPCPCGSRSPHGECCGPILAELRGGAAGPDGGVSPFGELRAAGAAHLWFVRCRSAEPTIRSSLSLAARRFWEAAGVPAPVSCDLVRDGDGPPVPGNTPGFARQALPETPDRRLPGYGSRLHRRLWSGVDGDTRRWLETSVPEPWRADRWFGETALDWLLWDAPWLAGRPAMWNFAPATSDAGTRTDVVASLLHSRPSVYRLVDHVEGAALVLGDELGGEPITVDTPTPPWPNADDRLVVRIYRFSSWTLAAGTGLLLPREVADAWIEMQRELAEARLPAAASLEIGHDGLAERRLKAWALPLLARLVARLKAIPRAGTHGQRHPSSSQEASGADRATGRLPAHIVSRRVH